MLPVVSPEIPIKPAGRARSRSAWGGVAAAGLALFLANAARTEADADLWGHLRFGLDTLSAGKLAETDPYSYTAGGAAWTNHEWLSELAFAGAYKTAGTIGLIVLRGVLLATTFAAIGVIVARRRLSPAATLVLMLFGMTYLPEFYRIRPQMFTYTAFAWLIVACDGYRRVEKGDSPSRRNRFVTERSSVGKGQSPFSTDGYRPDRRWTLVGLPILFGLWCNFHAGFVAGLGILGIYWCTFVYESLGRSIAKRDGETANDGPSRSAAPAAGRWLTALGTVGGGGETWFLAGVMASCVAATLCNPYGSAYWRFILAAVTMPRPEITEWAPVWSHHPVVIGCYLAAVLVPLICWLGSSRRGALAETAAFVLVGCLAARHARHIPFAMILGAVVFCRRWTEVGDLWGQARDRIRASGLADDGRLACGPLAKAAFILLAAAAIVAGTTKLTNEVAAAQTEGVLTVPSGLYPVAAVAFLDEQNITGNLYCGFSWGEYCLWHLAPRCPVFCDGRYETVYPGEISALALGTQSSQAERSAIIDHYPTDLALVPADAPFAHWLAGRADFSEIYRDPVARIFQRRNKSQVELRDASEHPAPATGAAPSLVPFPG